MTLVALDVLHVGAGKMLEVGADPDVGTAVVLVGTDPLLPDTWGKGTNVRTCGGAGNTMAVGTDVIVVGRCCGPGSATPAAVTGGIGAYLGCRLVGGIGAVGKIVENNVGLSLGMIHDAAVGLKYDVAGNTLAMAGVAVHFRRKIL